MPLWYQIWQRDHRKLQTSEWASETQRENPNNRNSKRVYQKNYTLSGTHPKNAKLVITSKKQLMHYINLKTQFSHRHKKRHWQNVTSFPNQSCQHTRDRKEPLQPDGGPLLLLLLLSLCWTPPATPTLSEWQGFSLKLGPRQGHVLSSPLFNNILRVLTSRIKQGKNYEHTDWKGRSKTVFTHR